MRHLHLDLSPDERDPVARSSMRPNIAVWHEPEDDINGEKCVTVSIDACWGVSQRFIDLTPGETRQLARMLVQAAEQADHVEIAA